MGRDVDVEFAEVALDRLPGAARRDAQCLVVIAARAAGGEGVPQPVAVLLGDAVRRVGHRGRALVGGDDEVGVVVVAHADVRRVHDATLDPVVGEIQQAVHEGDVLVAHLVLHEPRVERRMAEHEPTLGSGRNDDGVLGHLRLHEPEDLRAVVLFSVRPAKATARDHPAAQVDRLDPRGPYEDLVQR